MQYNGKSNLITHQLHVTNNLKENENSMQLNWQSTDYLQKLISSEGIVHT